MMAFSPVGDGSCQARHQATQVVVIGFINPETSRGRDFPLPNLSCMSQSCFPSLHIAKVKVCWHTATSVGKSQAALSGPLLAILRLYFR